MMNNTPSAARKFCFPFSLQTDVFLPFVLQFSRLNAFFREDKRQREGKSSPDGGGGGGH